MPGNPLNVKLGPGWLKVAALGSTEPVDLVAAWDAAWTDIGYTEEGHAFTVTPNFEAVEVAEELYPISYEQTGVEGQVEFAMAEMTARNLQLALNGGTITSSGAGATAITVFEPPAVGVVTRIMLGWESFAADERWIYRKCLQTGASELARRKAPDKTTIPATFQLELPSAGVKPWKAIQRDLEA